MHSFSTYIHHDLSASVPLRLGAKSNHLHNPGDVVVTAANESYESFPSILAQDSDSRELGSLLLEVGICIRPLLI